MDIKLKASLSNADSSSFTKTRCNQISNVYDLTCKYTGRVVTYRKIQELAAENKTLGNSEFSKTASAIRTIFPIVKKLGLIIDYDKFPEFKSEDFFSNKGKAFVLTHKSLMLAQEIENESLISKCQEIKAALLRDGICSMLSDKGNNSHNIWIALKTLKNHGEIVWKEFLYIVFLCDQGKNFEEIKEILTNNRVNRVEYKYVSEDNTAVNQTAYSYLKALLTEADIVIDYNKSTSKITKQGKELLNLLTI